MRVQQGRGRRCRLEELGLAAENRAVVEFGREAQSSNPSSFSCGRLVLPPAGVPWLVRALGE